MDTALSRSTPVSTVFEFGDVLLRTEDLDPLYTALVGADLPNEKLGKWLFAYWCCYHAGAASYLSEIPSDHYWAEFYVMADNITPTPLGGRWPRGHERRHFRGDKARAAATYYSAMNPRTILEDLTRDLDPLTFLRLRERVVDLPQFGPWIAFKVADMLERVANVPVQFWKDTDAVIMYKQPYQSALQVHAEFYPSVAIVDEKAAVRHVATELLRHFADRVAPPKNVKLSQRARFVGIQEVETILCKWKSHKGGHYPLGLDTRELRHALHQWSRVSPTAQLLLTYAPDEP